MSNNLILLTIERLALLLKKLKAYKFDFRKIDLFSLIIVPIQSMSTNKFVS